MKERGCWGWGWFGSGKVLDLEGGLSGFFFILGFFIWEKTNTAHGKQSHGLNIAPINLKIDATKAEMHAQLHVLVSKKIAKK